MSTLRECADALFHQKAVQGSRCEHLERQLAELEQAGAAHCRKLQHTLSDLERRAEAARELRRGNSRLAAQVAQCRLKMGALTLLEAEGRKRAAETERALESCESAWVGFPMRLVQVIRALRERRVMMDGAADALAAAEQLVTAVALADDLVGARTALRSHGIAARRTMQLFAERTVDKQTAVAGYVVELRARHHRAVTASAEHCTAAAAATRVALATVAEVQARDTYAGALSQRNRDVRAAVAVVAEHSDRLLLQREQQAHTQNSAVAQLQLLQAQTAGLREQHASALESHAAEKNAHTESLAALRKTSEELTQRAADVRSLATAAALRKSQELRALTAVCRVWALVRQREQQRDAWRVGAATEAAAAERRLAEWRRRHEEWMERQISARRAERALEALRAVEAEESLTRKALVFEQSREFDSSFFAAFSAGRRRIEEEAAVAAATAAAAAAAAAKRKKKAIKRPKQDKHGSSQDERVGSIVLGGDGTDDLDVVGGPRSAGNTPTDGLPAKKSSIVVLSGTGKKRPRRDVTATADQDTDANANARQVRHRTTRLGPHTAAAGTLTQSVYGGAVPSAAGDDSELSLLGGDGASVEPSPAAVTVASDRGGSRRRVGGNSTTANAFNKRPPGRPAAAARARRASQQRSSPSPLPRRPVTLISRPLTAPQKPLRQPLHGALPSPQPPALSQRSTTPTEASALSSALVALQRRHHQKQQQQQQRQPPRRPVPPSLTQSCAQHHPRVTLRPIAAPLKNTKEVDDLFADIFS